jgi:hypothetical protein
MLGYLSSMLFSKAASESSMLFSKAASEGPAKRRAASFDSAVNELNTCKRVQAPARSIFTEVS